MNREIPVVYIFLLTTKYTKHTKKKWFGYVLNNY